MRICDYDFLLSAYADDTTFFVKDIDSICRIFNLLSVIKSWSFSFSIKMDRISIDVVQIVLGDGSVLVWL